MSESTSKSTPRSVSWSQSWSSQNGSNPPVPSYSKAVYRWTDTFTGSRNPKWRDQVRAVVSATTPAGGFKRVVKYGVASGNVKWTTVQDPGQSVVYNRSVTVQSYVPDVFGFESNIALGVPSAETADNRAIRELYDQLIAMESSAQSGEDLGEISSTAQMLRGPMKSIRSVLTDTLQGHERALSLRGLGRTVKALADVVLEFNYGWSPAANSIATAMVGLQNRDYLGHFMPFSASGKHAMTGNWSGTDGISAARVQVSVVREHREEVRYHGVWGVKTNVDRRAVSDVLRLRWRDVIPTFYQLVPYSVLINYVSNLSTIADSYSVPYSGVRWCCRTNRNVKYAKATVGGISMKSPSYWNVGGSIGHGFSEYTDTTFGRSAVVDMPRASVEFDLDLSPKQMLNVGALIVSKLPILGALSKRAVARNPNLPRAFALEVRDRGIRVPYPFHN